jgi:hypothetical protein
MLIERYYAADLRKYRLGVVGFEKSAILKIRIVRGVSDALVLLSPLNFCGNRNTPGPELLVFSRLESSKARVDNSGIAPNHG